VFAQRLRQKLPHCQVWGFGSRARGTAERDADFDVCVVADTLDPEAEELIRTMAWEVGFENNVVITTVKYSRESFEVFPGRASPLVQAILRDGVPA